MSDENLDLNPEEWLQESPQASPETETPAAPESENSLDYKGLYESEKDKFLRLFAEFENYKRRVSKERLDLFKTAGKEVITSLLPISDDFDRALEQLSKTEQDGFFKGVELIRNKFMEALKSNGLEELKVEKGDAFDADIHEAITQIPASDEALKGKVMDVLVKGYKLGDKIIRYPKVVIGQY